VSVNETPQQTLSRSRTLDPAGGQGLYWRRQTALTQNRGEKKEQKQGLHGFRTKERRCLPTLAKERRLYSLTHSL